MGYETDEMVQRMLREEFRERTVVAIAHRISTVLGYDRIAVMEGGRLVEFDAPKALWERKGGVFRMLYDKDGIDEGVFGLRRGV